MRRAALGIGVFLLALAHAAAAHPGHGLEGGSESWLHYATEPLHVGPIALVAVALVVARRRRRPARARTR